MCNGVEESLGTMQIQFGRIEFIALLLARRGR